MVKSILTPENVDYHETDLLHENDLNKTIDVFQTKIHGMNVLVAIGRRQQKKQRSKKNTLFFYPVYLMKKHNVHKIGLIEINDSDAPLQLNLEENPFAFKFLLFENADKQLKKSEELLTEQQFLQIKNREMKDGQLPSFVVEKAESDIDASTNTSDGQSDLDAKKKKKEKPTYHNYIQTMFRDPLFEIVSVSGHSHGNNHNNSDANRFFYALAKGLQGDDQGNQDKNQNQDQDQDKARSEELEKKAESYRAFLAESVDETVLNDFKRYANMDDLKEEYAFMKNVEDVTQLQDVIKSNVFWANDWAIYKLEQHLNIKIIVFDKKEKNILCTEDFLKGTDETFHPTSYIMLSKENNNNNNNNNNSVHPPIYDLVTYKKKHHFSFETLPYRVKKRIAETCMIHKNTGIFYHIQDFKKFKAKEEEKEENPSKSRKPNPEQKGGSGGSGGGGLGPDSSNKSLYNEHIIFCVRNPVDPIEAALQSVRQTKSKGKADKDKEKEKEKEKEKDNAFPGKLSGEMLPLNKRVEFDALTKFPMWRMKLATKWLQPFFLSSLQWASVQHYCEACKFQNNHPAFFKLYSLDSGSEISTDPNLAILASLYVTNKIKDKPRSRKQLDALFASFPEIENEFKTFPKDIAMDHGYLHNHSRQKNILYEAHYAKFHQNEILKQILCATKDALLIAFPTSSSSTVSSVSPSSPSATATAKKTTKRKSAIYLMELMKVRQVFLWPEEKKEESVNIIDFGNLSSNIKANTTANTNATANANMIPGLEAPILLK
jgi:hypothetical protein